MPTFSEHRFGFVFIAFGRSFDTFGSILAALGFLLVPNWAILFDFDAIKLTMRLATPKKQFLFFVTMICVSIWASFFNQTCITFLLSVFILKPQPYNPQPHNPTHPQICKHGPAECALALCIPPPLASGQEHACEIYITILFSCKIHAKFSAPSPKVPSPVAPLIPPGRPKVQAGWQGAFFFLRILPICG